MNAEYIFRDYGPKVKEEPGTQEDFETHVSDISSDCQPLDFHVQQSQQFNEQLVQGCLRHRCKPSIWHLSLGICFGNIFLKIDWEQHTILDERARKVVDFPETP